MVNSGHPVDETWRVTPIVTYEQTMNDVEIASGLAVGDRLVVSGAFDLKAPLTAQGRSAAHSH